MGRSRRSTEGQGQGPGPGPGRRVKDIPLESGSAALANVAYKLRLQEQLNSDPKEEVNEPEAEVKEADEKACGSCAPCRCFSSRGKFKKRSSTPGPGPGPGPGKKRLSSSKKMNKPQVPDPSTPKVDALSIFSELNELEEEEGGQIGIGEDDKGQKKSKKKKTFACFPPSLRCSCCTEKDKKWEPPSKKKKFQSNEIAETEYPKMCRILEYKFWDVLFISSCLASILLFTFCEGFLIQSRLLWGLIHSVNALYIILLVLQWTQVILKSKYNQNHLPMDVIFTIVSVLPVDLAVLVAHALRDNENPEEVSQEDHLIFTISRLHYILRIKNILNYLSNWENQLILGDFHSFLIRVFLYLTLLVHTFACIWHRIACRSFRPKHFIMDAYRAREEICEPNSWMMKLSAKAGNQNNSSEFTPFLKGPASPYSILWDHYAVSLYWSVCTVFHVGFGDVQINVISMYEVTFTAMVQIVSWIFVLAVVIGTLTSLLIESDTERESYLTRRFAIDHYLKFSTVGKSVVHQVKKFYDYLWSKRKGVSELMLIDVMPTAMKSEIFFDVHKFVLEQMPLFQDLEPSLLMTLSIRMTHSFHLTGETLFLRHERGDHMFYVLKGHLDIMSADETHPIACIRSGSAIGDVFLLHPYIHCCTVRCGSECDILALTRSSVTEVLRDYPQYVDLLQTRIQKRFEDCTLLLSLAAKYDEAPALFAKLPFEMPLPDIVEAGLDLDPEEKDLGGNKKRNYSGSDADGLSLTSSVMEKMSTMYMTAAQKKDKKIDKRRKNALEDAYGAFAADVNRTCLLAKDLGIGRVPLLISTPGLVVSVNNGPDSSSTNIRSSRDGGNVITKLLNEESSSALLIWRLFVSLCICSALFYYPYMLAYRSSSPKHNLQLDAAMHLVDVVCFIDFCFEMFQIVVTPQKTLERLPEILLYRAKTLTFYLRILGCLPIEYVVAGILNWEFGASAYFYMLKYNRFFEIIVLLNFFQDLEGVTKIPMMAVFLSKYLLTILFAIHTFAIMYTYIWRDWLPGVVELVDPDTLNNSIANEEYEYVLYWATQVVTTAGFGDLSYRFDEEIFLFCFGFVVGTLVTTYLGSKLAAILANAQRRRISFKQTYYGVTQFLKQRKFPEDLSRRIKAYYQMQWIAHEGVLIPKDKSAIWDSPEAILDQVSLSQSLHYISRVPIVRHTSESVIKCMCRALKQYFVPPDECVQFEGDKRRELYIIVKGFCKVTRGTECIGYLTEGNYFGLNGLVVGINEEYRITTETHCLFFCLQFDDFLDIAKAYKLLRKDYMVLRGETKLEDLKRVVETDGAAAAVPPEDAPESKAFALLKTRSKSDRNKFVGVGDIFDSYSSTILMEDELTDSNNSRGRGREFLRCFLLRRTFLPSGGFMTCWVILRVIAASLASYFVVMALAFAFNPKNAFITMLVFDSIAWIDMYLMLHVSYYNAHNQLITDPIKTARNYLRGSFLLDLIFSFPCDLVAVVANPEIDVFYNEFAYFGKYQLISILRLNRVFQVYKLIQCGFKLNQTIFKSLSIITLIEVMPWMMLAIHFMACLAVLSVCDVSLNGDNFNCSADAWLTHGAIYNGIEHEDPSLDDPFKMYVIAFYWTIVVALRVGFGDVDVLNRDNRLICVCIIIAGCLITSYLSSKLTACMVGEDSRRIEIRTKIDIMYSFLDRFKASGTVKRRVKEIYFNEWDKTKGISVDNLFVALHPSLKADVLCHLYEDSIRQSPLLKTLDEPGIRMLSSILREVFIVEGEYIFKYGNITDDLFLISSGIVAAYNGKGDVMSYMGAGSLIGEISALYGVNRLYSAVAATDIDMLVFSAEDFLDFLELYPDLKEALEQLCENMSEAQQIVPGSGSGSAQRSDGSKIIDPDSAIPNAKKGRAESDSEKDSKTIGSRKTDASKSGGDEFLDICVLDPLRVPLKSGQLMERKKELMLQGGDSRLASKKWWSVFVTFGRVPKTEIGAFLHIFQDQKRCNLLNFTIHPASAMVRGSGWSVFNLLVTAISCGLTAYEISFTSTNVSESWHVSAIRYMTELFFLIRIVGNFHLGYWDDSGVIITDVKIIAKKYVTRVDGFILDISTTIPFYTIAYMIGGPDEGLHAANIRGIQLLRVVLFIRYLSETGTDLLMKASEVKILKITILLCFIFHFCACAWYLVACYGMTCAPNSWMEVLLHKQRTSKAIGQDEDIPIGSRYWISLAYVTTTITATGLNDVTPRATVELLATILFIFGTVFILGFLLGEMTQCLASQISRKIHYEHELSVIESHLAGLGLNKSKRDSVSEYFKLAWRSFRGIPYYSLLSEMPYPLRSDISYEIYGPNIRMSRVLGKVGEQVIRQITARIQHEFYLPGGYVVRGGCVCDAMYFIKRGEVLIIDENMGIELVVDTLRENDCFGEVKILLPREPFRFSYVARVESEVGMLRREDLEEVFKNFPHIQRESVEWAQGIKTHRSGDARNRKDMEPEPNFDENSNSAGPGTGTGTGTGTGHNVSFEAEQDVTPAPVQEQRLQTEKKPTPQQEQQQQQQPSQVNEPKPKRSRKIGPPRTNVMVSRDMRKASIAKIETLRQAATPPNFRSGMSNKGPGPRPGNSKQSFSPSYSPIPGGGVDTVVTSLAPSPTPSRTVTDSPGVQNTVVHVPVLDPDPDQERDGREHSYYFRPDALARMKQSHHDGIVRKILLNLSQQLLAHGEGELVTDSGSGTGPDPDPGTGPGPVLPSQIQGQGHGPGQQPFPPILNPPPGGILPSDPHAPPVPFGTNLQQTLLYLPDKKAKNPNAPSSTTSPSKPKPKPTNKPTTTTTTNPNPAQSPENNTKKK